MSLHPHWLDWPQTQTLLAAFAKHGVELRFVGGGVRDALLGIDAMDIDAATPATPQVVTALLEQAQIRAIPTGIAHGTITALMEGKSFEITTLRRDDNCDGRHAHVTFTDDWKEDAARRDFTMNALFLLPQGELLDYFGGEADAKAGRLRFIGDPAQRIGEDYLRILRFFRFFAWYGKGAPDEQAVAACSALAEHIETLSGERVQHEMLRLLTAPAPLGALKSMHEAGVLSVVCGFSVTRLEPLQVVTNLHERLALLLLLADISPKDALACVAVRWRLSGDDKKWLMEVITQVDTLQEDISLARQKQLIRQLGADMFSHCVRVSAALLGDQTPYVDMLDFAARWHVPTLPVTGKDLLALGIPEGKALGECLRKLEERWEASDYQMDRETLLKKINE